MSVRINGLDRFQKKIKESYVTQELRFAMEETVEFTEEVMRDAVETSGTDRAWGGIWARNGRQPRDHSGAGRVETGKMRDSIESEVEVKGNSQVIGRVGWLKGTPEYTKFQELGFRHAITKEFIEGMMATREGAEQGLDELLSQLDKSAKRIFK